MVEVTVSVNCWSIRKAFSAASSLLKRLKIKSAKISFLRIYIYRGGDLRDEDLFVHRLLSPLVAVFVCNHFLNGSCDMSQVAFITR